MSETVAVHSTRGQRLPARLVTIALAALLLIVTVVTIALFVAASSGSGEAPPTTVPNETSSQPCPRFPVNTPC
jgi:hypothetical protein